MEYNAAQRPHTVGSVPKIPLQSDVIFKILQDIKREARGPVLKPKPPPKNHMKENLKRLKEIEARTKQKLAEKKPLQPLKVVPNKYLDVQSKINKESSQSQKTSPQHNKPPKTAGPFRRPQPPLSPTLSTKSEHRGNLQTYRSLPQLNKADENEDIESGRSDTDSEKYGLRVSSPKKKSDFKALAPHPLGHIPSYLTERKKQWELERERQVKLKEESSIPNGYTLLPDEERIETLELLIKNEEELHRSLAALPVRNDTMRLRNYKEELEKQLSKVEEGIKIFSKPKVLIKNDA